MKTPRYGTYRGHAARFMADRDEAWFFVDGRWQETREVFIRLAGAPRLTKQAFLRRFGTLPPLPRHAFDPNRPKFGSWDGSAVRWLDGEAWQLGWDGKWRECNAADVVMKAWPMTEAEYRRSFGPAYQRRHGPVPPLPRHAFGGDATNG